MDQETLAQENAQSENLERSRRHLFLITKKGLVLQREINKLLKKPSSKKVTEDIEELQAQLDKLDLDFESMATQLALEDIAEQEKSKLDWMQEIEELTKPLLTAIRNLTEKPRQIDELKGKIEDLEAKFIRHQEASKNISTILEDLEREPPPDREEGKKYQTHLLRLRDKYDPELVQLNLEKARANLKSVLGTDESVIENATQTIKEFFRTRGRNLLVTVLTFMGFWWLLSRLRRWILARKFLTKRTSSIGKLFSAAYTFVVLLFCLLIGLACLYFFNDWLLITLIIMGLFLVVWTSRQWIPQFFQEIKLIVDLGTVREGQRLIWNGVPWLVKEIRLQAILVNERLEGGEIILPLHMLVDLHSRPVVDNEPWFPTEPHDWVLLGDDTYGRVEYQTMEQVVINLKEGGALKYYSTEDFLSQNPVNISNGFEYSIEFGLDYEVQPRICDEIPMLFEKEIKRHLKHQFEGDDPNFYELEVIFDNAGASSLNIAIEVYVHGRCAHRYDECRREIQTTLVRICNEHNLGIPFDQLTVHLPKEAEESSTSELPDQPREDRV
ncbi:MAG: hypothetical protein NPINA01_06880 [Nitrospinaceae bacterium]|nr:MAG: hypothetical protein NPINA01_06880 [Nitrospinaceae bacterium]